jgi:hypothetical protein
MVVGFMSGSLSEITGNSSGKPPADHRPAAEGVVGEPLGLHPPAVEQAVEVLASEPELAAEPRARHAAPIFSR